MAPSCTRRRPSTLALTQAHDKVLYSHRSSRASRLAIGAADAANGLVMGVGLCLHQLWACLDAHGISSWLPGFKA